MQEPGHELCERSRDRRSVCLAPPGPRLAPRALAGGLQGELGLAASQNSPASQVGTRVEKSSFVSWHKLEG